LARRLRPITEEVPKALVPVGGKPIIEWQIKWLKSFGVDTIVVLAGYLYEKLIEFLGSGRKFGVRVVYSIEEKPLGTAGALKNAEGVLGSEPFLAVNGDIITNINIAKLVKAVSESPNVLVGMALVPLKSPYGIVEIDKEGYIRAFREKPLLSNYLINAGVYYMKPETLKYVPPEGDLERTTFPQLARELKIKGVPYSDVFWRSIDTVKDVQEASKEVELIFSH
jgi:mannose-1-phosphate guanylyltransferase